MATQCGDRSEGDREKASIRARRNNRPVSALCSPPHRPAAPVLVVSLQSSLLSSIS